MKSNNFGLMRFYQMESPQRTTLVQISFFFYFYYGAVIVMLVIYNEIVYL